MKRIVGIVLLLIVLLVVMRVRSPTSPIPQHPIPPSPTPQLPVSSSSPPLQNFITPSTSPSSDLRLLHTALGNFLFAVKDPYRPPLGDNRDIARALTGHNRRGLVFVPTNDPSLRDGQLIDRWGTPYWFHPRSSEAIDIVSAGPDRKLFTADDLVVGPP